MSFDVKTEVGEKDKERILSLASRFVNAVLLGVVVFLITPGRIGQGFRMLWNLYTTALVTGAALLGNAILEVWTWLVEPVWNLGAWTNPPQPAAGQPPAPWHQRRWFRIAVFVVGIILALVIAALLFGRVGVVAALLAATVVILRIRRITVLIAGMLFIPAAAWLYGAWVGGVEGRVVIAVGGIMGVALAHTLWLVLLLLARGGQLLVESVQKPAVAALKFVRGIFKSIAPDAVEEREGEIEFINTERLVAAVSSTRIVPMILGVMSFWLLLFPSFTTLFVGVLVFFGGPALIHMGGLWGYETEWGKMALFRWTKVMLGIAIVGIVFMMLLPKSAEWIWSSSGGVDQAMVSCVSDPGACVVRPFRTPAPVISRQADEGIAAADRTCEWRFRQLQTRWERGGMRFADYRTQWERHIRSCERDRESVTVVVAEVNRPIEDRIISALPILGWIAIIAFFVSFFRGLFEVRKLKAEREAASDEVERRLAVAEGRYRWAIFRLGIFSARGWIVMAATTLAIAALFWYLVGPTKLAEIHCFVPQAYWYVAGIVAGLLAFYGLQEMFLQKHWWFSWAATAIAAAALAAFIWGNAEAWEAQCPAPRETVAEHRPPVPGEQAVLPHHPRASHAVPATNPARDERIRWVEEHGAATCPELLTRLDWRRMHDPRAACRLEGIRRQFAWMSEPQTQ